MGPILTWLAKNLGGVLGIAQAIVKLAKEVLTLIVDILYPLIPSAKFQAIVDKIRSIVNAVDGWLEKIKGFLVR